MLSFYYAYMMMKWAMSVILFTNTWTRAHTLLLQKWAVYKMVCMVLADFFKIICLFVCFFNAGCNSGTNPTIFPVISHTV